MENNIHKIEFNNYKQKIVYKDTSKSSNENYSKSYEESYYELIKHIQKAPSEYKSFIESIRHDWLDNTISYRNNYKCIALPNKTILLCHEDKVFDTSAEFFKYLLSHTPIKLDVNINFDDTYFKRLYNLYYAYLKHFAIIPKPYDVYYYSIHKIRSKYSGLYDLFKHKHNYFAYINKEILFNDPVNKDIGFSTDVIEMLKRHCKHTKQFVPLLNLLPEIVGHANFYTSAPCCSSNYSFNVSAKGIIFHAYFDNGEIKCEKNTNIHISTLSFYAITSNYFTPISYSQSLLDILYDITGGIKQNMDNFSILFSLITTNYYKNTYYTLPSKNLSPISLYAIYAPDGQTKVICHWLKELLPSTHYEPNYQLKDLTKPENILYLIRKNYFVPSYIPVSPSKSKESESQIKTIKKLIQRKEITVKDSYGFNHKLINSLPVICFVDNIKQLNWLQANFKTTTLTFKSLPPLSDTKQYLYKLEELKEMICTLGIYGLKLLYEKDFKCKNNKNSYKQPQSISENFINDYLKFEENHVLYADDLYKLYVNYYELFYGGTPLTKICFTKEMRKLLPCQYKKPRHSRSDNRYAFIGISIDNEKAHKVTERTDIINYNSEKEAFSDYLSQIQDTVNEILQALHNEIYNP